MHTCMDYINTLKLCCSLSILSTCFRFFIAVSAGTNSVITRRILNELLLILVTMTCSKTTDNIIMVNYEELLLIRPICFLDKFNNFFCISVKIIIIILLSYNISVTFTIHLTVSIISDLVAVCKYGFNNALKCVAMAKGVASSVHITSI